MRRVKGADRGGRRVPAAADDHVHRAVAGVDLGWVIAARSGRQQGTARQYAAHGEGPLEMVLVAGHDEIHAVGVKERQELLPDSDVGPVEVGGGHRDLMHADHDPVDLR